MPVGLGTPFRRCKGRHGEIEGVSIDLGNDKEVRRDVVAFGIFVTIADVVGILAILEVELVDVVLDGVLGIGELLVQGNAFRVRAIRVILTIADVIDAVFLADEGLIQVDVVHQLAVLLVLECRQFV